ncbi:hypothetical protein [Spirillospora sp. CA-294931]|uniref:hypothetical protein n=1 Tax=Spirillospora sp. CA-294931 TaxID=3240042 RepID=UPI003D93F971
MNERQVTPPEIHQFTVTGMDGNWRAVPKYEITPFMASAGCVEAVYADDPDDLHLQCMKERIRVDMIRAAEELQCQDEQIRAGRGTVRHARGR